MVQHVMIMMMARKTHPALKAGNACALCQVTKTSVTAHSLVFASGKKETW